MTKKFKIWIGIAAAVLMVGSFVAGMEYQTYRIKSAVVDAFSDFGSEDEASQEETAKEAPKETVGAFFDFSIPYADDGANKVSIRVDGIECGIAKLEAPDEYSDDATPGDGMAFCKAEGTARNDGKKPLEVPNFGGLVTDAGEFGTDDEASIEHGKYAETLNPGQSDKFIAVYEVPDDAKAQGVYYSSDSSLDDGLVLVSVN